MSRSLPARLWVLSVVAAVGCNRGPTVYPVEGRLEYADGTPVPGRASVAFHQTVDGKGYTGAGRVEADGTFKLSTFKPDDGAVAGENGVSITPIPGGEEAAVPTVGPKYGTAESSGLKFTVESGTNRPVLKIDRPEKGKK